MAGRPPFFAFYPVDFSGDIHVEAMSTLQVGAYILLLCKAWQADPPASLPNDDSVLARLARLTPDEWAEVKAGVLSVFSLGTDNRWHQKRLRQEYETAKALIRKRVAAGKEGASRRWSCEPHAIAIADPLPSQCADDAIQSQIQTEDKNPLAAKPPKKARKPREPDLLFDAIAEVTASDPEASGSFIGKAAAALRRGKFTPEEVREFARRFQELCWWAKRDGRTHPELGELQKNIGKVRVKPHGSDPNAPKFDSFQGHTPMDFDAMRKPA